METYVLDLQRMSTEDGPGIRTTVFFKGCNLNCAWCHNPESIAFYKQKYWISDKCMGCRICEKGCPNNAISFNEDGLFFDEKKCNFCEKCYENCPANAIEIKGKKYSVDELVHICKKDISFYNNSGGGVTVSGGEAILHTDFVVELLQKLKENGISTALDTAGNYPFPMLKRVLPYLDLILYDIKIFDSEMHKKFTGVENNQILQNLIRLGKTKNPKIWIRTPIIPGATDDEKNRNEIGKFIKENIPNIEKWELLAFNNLSKDKYRLLNKKWKYENADLIKKSQMVFLQTKAKKYFEKVEISGMTKLEE